MKYTLPLILAIAAASVSAAEWPQFYGPNRDNKSTDKGLLKTWPEGGPSRIWEATGIGQGYSTVAIVGKMIYTTGAIDEDCVITALDMGGRRVWTRKNGKAWEGSYPGTRSTPTITDGLLYHLSGIGNLICLKADSGEAVWSTNILETFEGRNTTWGLAESPLVVGDKVICTPGGEDVSLVALDRKTGKVVWKCTGAGDKPGYSSPILVEHLGLKQIVTAMSESIVGVRASDGNLLWRYPHKVFADENITTPLFHDGFLIVSGCVKKGTTSLQLQVSGDECSVEKHWHNKTLDNKQGGIVLLDGRLYGYADTQSKSEPWMCMDFKSGETIFQSTPVKSSYKYKCGCLTYADGMFYLFSDNGNMSLVKPMDKGFEVVGRLKIEDPGKRPTWAYPVVFGGRLYVRYGDKLGVYDVAGRVDHKERVHGIWRPLPSVHEGGLLAERVELWRKKRLWHMVDSGYLLSGFQSRPGRHPWQGEHVGKWLHAATLAYEQTRDEKLGKTLQETVERLLAAQQPNGYLGTYAEKDRFYKVPAMPVVGMSGRIATTCTVC